MYFAYGEAETEYLKRKDKALGAVIDAVGHVWREVDGDLFAAVVHQIVGQQISNKALATVWQRVQAGLGAVPSLTDPAPAGGKAGRPRP